jgi:DNA-binding transcriptional LysR family regulator
MLLELAEGQLDLAIAPAGLRLPQGLAAESIGALQWRCFGRRGHPAFQRWGRRAWAQWPHVVVRVGDQLESPVNIAAGAAGLGRTIAGWLPNFSAVAPVLAASDLLATLPAPAMAGTLGAHRLESRRVPFAIAPLPHVLLWSSVRTQDPEVAWLRRLLAPLARTRFAATPGASR